MVGTRHAKERGFERVYEELRQLARQRLRQGLAGPSLQATGLVHEAWLKISEGELAVGETSRFYATAALGQLEARGAALPSGAMRRSSSCAYCSLRDGNAELYLVRVDGRGARRLTNHTAQDLAPAWIPR